jgi:hypothetical protein
MESAAMDTQAERSMIFELLHHDHYSPDELARVLGMDIHVILQEARTNKLKAYIVDHHVLDIHRKDVLEWLNMQQR